MNECYFFVSVALVKKTCKLIVVVVVAAVVVVVAASHYKMIFLIDGDDSLFYCRRRKGRWQFLCCCCRCCCSCLHSNLDFYLDKFLSRRILPNMFFLPLFFKNDALFLSITFYPSWYKRCPNKLQCGLNNVGEIDCYSHYHQQIRAALYANFVFL